MRPRRAGVQRIRKWNVVDLNPSSVRGVGLFARAASFFPIAQGTMVKTPISVGLNKGFPTQKLEQPARISKSKGVRCAAARRGARGEPSSVLALPWLTRPPDPPRRFAEGEQGDPPRPLRRPRGRRPRAVREAPHGRAQGSGPAAGRPRQRRPAPPAPLTRTALQTGGATSEKRMYKLAKSRVRRRGGARALFPAPAHRASRPARRSWAPTSAPCGSVRRSSASTATCAPARPRAKALAAPTRLRRPWRPVGPCAPPPSSFYPRRGFAAAEWGRRRGARSDV